MVEYINESLNVINIIIDYIDGSEYPMFYIISILLKHIIFKEENVIESIHGLSNILKEKDISGIILPITSNAASLTSRYALCMMIIDHIL